MQFRLMHCNITKVVIIVIASVMCTACGPTEDLVIYRNAGQIDEPKMEEVVDETSFDFSSEQKIMAYLDGREMVMDGSAVPTHPNGFDENINFGQATQCIHRVTMQISAQNFRVSTVLGTLVDAPMPEDIGTCDRATPNGNPLTFDTTTAAIQNVRDNGGCFDLTLIYSGFGQEGRGSISDDGKTVRLELFFRDQAVGHRCDAGDVGEPTITLNQEPFLQDAVQTYSVR